MTESFEEREQYYKAQYEQYTKRLIGALNQFTRSLMNCSNQLLSISTSFKPLCSYNYTQRVSYNAKYWKITDNRKLDIQLMIYNFGSNEQCYYQKIYR